MSQGAELVRGVGLVKRFGGIVANDAVDLVVAEGDLVGLIGPNGSGKTTLINCISGAFRTEARTVWRSHGEMVRRSTICSPSSSAWTMTAHSLSAGSCVAVVKLAEQTLCESEERFRAAFEQAAPFEEALLTEQAVHERGCRAAEVSRRQGRACDRACAAPRAESATR